MKYLGIDYSAKKVGLALGDDTLRLAVPFDVLSGGEDVLHRILVLAVSERINAFVVGVPVPFRDVHHTKQHDRVLEFIKQLKEQSGLPVYEIDEVMTTREAKRVQDEYGSTVKEDALAAMFILQEFFDTHETRETP